MDENLRNKLTDFQSTPPKGAWDFIALSLDEKESDQRLAKKLNTFESKPPAKTWENISEHLNKTSLESTLVTPIKRSPVVSILKYAIAASIIGLIVFGINGLFNTGNDSTLIGETPKIEIPQKVATNNNDTEGIIPEKVEESIIDQSLNQVALASGKKEATSNEILPEPGVRISNINAALKTTKLTPSISTTLSDETITNDLSAEIASLNEQHNNRYMMFVGSDGSLIKMSKKIATMLGCTVGPNLSVGMNCMEQLNTWREKLANSPITTSADNFMDIIDIIKSITDTP